MIEYDVDVVKRIMETGLFIHSHRRENVFSLLETQYYFVYNANYTPELVWCVENYYDDFVLVSFENVFDNVPDEIKEKMVFHLDLFQ